MSAEEAIAPPEGVKHLRKVDPVMRGIIDRVPGLGPRGSRVVAPGDHYGALVRSIVGQQLSSKAAYSIYTRLCDRYGGRTPSPRELLDDDPEEMRAAAGLSRSKVGFMRSLAEHILDGTLELDRMDSLPDEEVIAELVAVKGIGEWTAHMFLIFHLLRPDVLAVGDLGIRSAVRNEYGLDELPDRDETERIGAPWAPWRSLACRYLWRSLDNEPV